jgi:hypothetical protein
MAGEKTNDRNHTSLTLNKLVEQQHQPSLRSRNHAPFRQAGGYPHETSCSFSRETHQLEDKETRRQGLCQDRRGIEHILGVSPYYVGTIWRKHKQDILDTVSLDLVKSLKTLPGSGCHYKSSVVELYAKVKAVPFHYRKNVCDLGLQG